MFLKHRRIELYVKIYVVALLISLRYVRIFAYYKKYICYGELNISPVDVVNTSVISNQISHTSSYITSLRLWDENGFLNLRVRYWGMLGPNNWRWNCWWPTQMGRWMSRWYESDWLIDLRPHKIQKSLENSKVWYGIGWLIDWFNSP